MDGAIKGERTKAKSSDSREAYRTQRRKGREGERAKERTRTTRRRGEGKGKNKASSSARRGVLTRRGRPRHVQGAPSANQIAVSTATMPVHGLRPTSRMPLCAYAAARLPDAPASPRCRLHLRRCGRRRGATRARSGARVDRRNASHSLLRPSFQAPPSPTAQTSATPATSPYTPPPMLSATSVTLAATGMSAYPLPSVARLAVNHSDVVFRRLHPSISSAPLLPLALGILTSVFQARLPPSVPVQTLIFSLLLRDNPLPRSRSPTAPAVPFPR